MKMFGAVISVLFLVCGLSGCVSPKGTLNAVNNNWNGVNTDEFFL
jgi:hypothetical protein